MPGGHEAVSSSLDDQLLREKDLRSVQYCRDSVSETVTTQPDGDNTEGCL